TMLTTYSFAAPKGVTDKLQASDDIVKKATRPEQFGEALKLLNDGLLFADPVRGYGDDRRNAVIAAVELQKLTFAKHPALVAYITHYDKCLKDADTRLTAATKPQDVEQPRLTLQGMVQSMLPETVDANAKLAEADGKIKEAEASLAELVDYKFVDLTAA